MRHFSCLLIFLLVPVTTQGARIYRLVDYPDLHNGHTLSGTITTTDEAPDDGLLASEEITDWRWTITGPNNQTAVLAPAANTTTQATGILINTDSISVSFSDFGRLSMRQLNDGAQEINPWPSLQWTNGFRESVEEYVFSMSAGLALEGLDATFSAFYLSQFSSGGTDSFVVATIVPEPSQLGCCGLILLAMCKRKWRRKSIEQFMPDSQIILE